MAAKDKSGTGGLKWDKETGFWVDDDPVESTPSTTDLEPWPRETRKTDDVAEAERALRADDIDAYFAFDDDDDDLGGGFDDYADVVTAQPAPGRVAKVPPAGPGRGFPDPAAFAAFIAAATVEPETQYGRGFEEMMSVTPAPRFFEDANAESVLADIEALNRKHGVSDVVVPGTAVKLVNYTYCPKCRTVHSRRDVLTYFSNPKPPEDRLIPRRQQLRGDARVACKSCGEMFLPSLLVVDGKPTSECPFLGTLQTIDAIEVVYLRRYKRKVLTRNPQNVLMRRGRRVVRNDVMVGDLMDHPTLIANLVLHTPPRLVEPLLLGRNLEREDPLMGLTF